MSVVQTSYGSVPAQSYNRNFTVDDIKQMMLCIKSKPEFSKFIEQYNVRCIRIPGADIPVDLLDVCVQSDDIKIVRYIISRLVYDDLYKNLVNVQVQSIHTQNIRDLIVYSLGSFGKDYEDEMKEYRQKLGLAF